MQWIVTKHRINEIPFSEADQPEFMTWSMDWTKNVSTARIWDDYATAVTVAACWSPNGNDRYITLWKTVEIPPWI